nr:MAG TPA: hypothetical protein [Caudoviricetes sp.]
MDTLFKQKTIKRPDHLYTAYRSAVIFNELSNLYTAPSASGWQGAFIKAHSLGGGTP